MKVTRDQKYRVPENLINYLLHGPIKEEFESEEICEISDGLFKMQLNAIPEVRFEGEFEEKHLKDLAGALINLEGLDGALNFVRSVVVAGDPIPGVEPLIGKILEDFKETVFACDVPLDRPVRGPFGEATIELKPGAQPVKQRPFYMVGERREAPTKLVDGLERDGKLELVSPRGVAPRSRSPNRPPVNIGWWWTTAH